MTRLTTQRVGSNEPTWAVNTRNTFLLGGNWMPVGIALEKAMLNPRVS
jgi:hypothetical protein